MDGDDPLNKLVYDLHRMTDQRSMFRVLHDTAQRFENDRRYLNDTRYVCLWLHYASFFRDPGWVFRHMLQKRIGERVGLFYEQVAEYYGEQKDRWKKAKALVRLGIQKRAGPESRLRTALEYIRRRELSHDDKHAESRQEQRMATVRRCCSQQEEVSFEELRAWHHQTSFGSRSEEARLNLTPQTPSTDHASTHVGIPHCPAFLRHIWARLAPPLHAYPGYHDAQPLPICPTVQIGSVFRFAGNSKVVRKVGQGGLAAIYLMAAADGHYALKVETPPNPWEFYILCQLKRRLQNPSLCIKARAIHVYKNVSFLALDYADQGTLLDCFNRYRQNHRKQAMPELAALFMTLRLLEAVEDMHAANIIHGDLKLDNTMMAMEQCRLPAQFDNSNEQWKKQYLVLIDFGRSVDLTLLPSEVKLKATWSPDLTDSVAVRQGQPFPPRALDYYGIAAAAHWLLFGKQMTVKQDKSMWVIEERLRRYWHVDLWQDLFISLLNPNNQELKALIRKCSNALRREGNTAACVSQLWY